MSEIKKIMTPWRNQSMSRYRKKSKPTNSGGTTPVPAVHLQVMELILDLLKLLENISRE